MPRVLLPDTKRVHRCAFPTHLALVQDGKPSFQVFVPRETDDGQLSMSDTEDAVDAANAMRPSVGAATVTTEAFNELGMDVYEDRRERNPFHVMADFSQPKQPHAALAQGVRRHASFTWTPKGAVAHPKP